MKVEKKKSLSHMQELYLGLVGVNRDARLGYSQVIMDIVHYEQPLLAFNHKI